MWKKPEADEPVRPASTTPIATPAAPAQHSQPGSTQRTATAMIAPSLVVQGEVSGEDDLLIQGRVEGKVELRKSQVTVGRQGKVKADIVGRVIDVEGQVEGNLFGEEQVILRQSGSVRGNITSPRVVLEDGATFKGSIDMEGKTTAQRPLSAAPAVPITPAAGGAPRA